MNVILLGSQYFTLVTMLAIFNHSNLLIIFKFLSKYNCSIGFMLIFHLFFFYIYLFTFEM